MIITCRTPPSCQSCDAGASHIHPSPKSLLSAFATGFTVMPMQSALPKQTKFFYGWVVVGITVVVLLLSAGVRSAPGVMLDAQLLDTGWQRMVLSSAVSLGLAVFGLGAPLAGSLIARFGARLIALIGLLLMGISMLISARLMTQTELNLFWGVLSGFGTALAGSVIGATVANRWFVARRGMVTGLFGAAGSAGQLIFIPLLTRWTDTLGWRSTSFILGVALLVLLLPVLLLMRDDPSKVGQLPYGATAPANQNSQERGGQLPLPPERSRRADERGFASDARGGVMAQALRTPTFWLLAITFFVCGFSSNGIIGTHFKSYALDCGIPSGTAANLLAVMGVMNFFGTLDAPTTREDGVRERRHGLHGRRRNGRSRPLLRR